MKTKRILCLVLSILLLAIAPVNALTVEVNENITETYLEEKYSSDSVIFMKDEYGQVKEILMTDFYENVPSELLNTTREMKIPIHKEIPTVGGNLVKSFSLYRSTWTHNTEMDNYSNKHFQVLTEAALVTFMSSFFGGAAAIWTGFATGIYAAYETTENVNVYYFIQYYWQFSDDAVFPYYIRQDTHAYKDSARTEYIGTSSRYYYSTLTY
nr:hypothetical protein [Sedimentibacter sp.]